ncbi:forkhead box protein B2, partial [Biomphalaria glabrata]
NRKNNHCNRSNDITTRSLLKKQQQRVKKLSGPYLESLSASSLEEFQAAAMNGLLQMGSGPAQMPPGFSHPHHGHYNSNAHHHHHHHTHPHLGQLYQQQRPSFAIQEILGLGCRQPTSPSPVGDGGLMDPSAGISAVQNSLGGMYFPGQHMPQGLQNEPQNQGYHQSGPQHGGSHPHAAATGPLYPWRFDLTSTTTPQTLPGPRFPGVGRHAEELNFGYKHNIADEGRSL